MNITLSINPSYLCNFSCDFCYLTPSQLRDNTRLSLHLLDERLREITTKATISHVDLYGGEIGTLPIQYIDDMFAVITKYYQQPINVVTNLSKMPRYNTDSVTMSVSFDFACREQHEQVLENIKSYGKPVHILMLASPCLVKQDVSYMIRTFNGIPNVSSVEIKPYSANQANILPVSYREYETFVQKWIQSEIPKQFTLVNEELLQEVILGTRNAFSNDHLYITPTGDLAVLEFDLNDREYFMALKSFDEYIEWAAIERNRVFANSYCSQCEYLGRCLSEHLRNVRDISNSCNGFYGLIKWYERT